MNNKPITQLRIMKNNQNKILNRRNIFIVTILLIALYFLYLWNENISYRPTPLILGQWVVKEGAKIMADRFVVGKPYKNARGNHINPSPGFKFVYIDIKAINLAPHGSELLGIYNYNFELVVDSEIFTENNSYWLAQENNVDPLYPPLPRVDYMKPPYERVEGWLQWEVPVELNIEKARLQIIKLRPSYPALNL